MRAPHIKHRHGGKLHEFTECCSLVDALLSHEASKGQRKGKGADVVAGMEHSEEHERLVGMWDGIKKKKMEEFMPKLAPPSQKED